MAIRKSIHDIMRGFSKNMSILYDIIYVGITKGTYILSNLHGMFYDISNNKKLSTLICEVSNVCL